MMTGIRIPSNQLDLPEIDWHAEDKLQTWKYYKTRMTWNFTVAGTSETKQDEYILFFCDKKATEW